MKDPVMIYAHTSHVNSVVFTADSRTMLSAGMDNVVKLWTVPDWTQVAILEGHDGSVNSLALSPDGSHLLTASTDQTARLWRLPGGAPVKTLRHRANLATVSPDGRFALTAFKNRVNVTTWSEEKDVFAIRAHGERIHAFSFSPDSRILATGGRDDVVELWAVPSGDHVGALRGHERVVMNVAFPPNGRYLATAGHEGTLRLWETEAWTETARVELPVPGMYGMAISPNSRIIALTLDHHVLLISAEDGTISETIGVKPKGVYGVAFSPDGHWLAVTAADRRVRLWELS